MEEQVNYIDNVFREGLGNYTESPPPAAWDALEKKLDNPVRRRFPFMWLMLAFVSSAVVLGVVETKKHTGIAATTPANTGTGSAAAQPVASVTGGKTTIVANDVPSATQTTTVVNTNAVSSENTQTTGTQPAATTQKQHKALAATSHSRHTHAVNAGADNTGDNNTANNDVATGPVVPNTAAANATEKTKNNTAPAIAANKTAGTTLNGTTPKTKTGDVPKENNAPNAATLTTVSAAPATASTKKAKGKKHENQPVAKNKTASENDNITTHDAAKATNNQTAIVATKQNNIKVVSEVPADVLAANEQKKAAAAKQAENKMVAATTSTPPAAPQKVALNEVHPLKTKSAFTETITTIKIDAPATIGGNGGGATADAGKIKTPRWEVGLKGGYESGTKAITANKFDFAPFLKYNISKKASILVQPGVKFAKINNTAIDPAKYYYNIANSNIAKHETPLYDPTTSQLISTTYEYNYYESGDSFKVGHNIAQRNFVEFEIPIMFSYQVSKDLSILAGISMVYSKLVGMSKDSSNYTTFNNSSNPTTISYANVPAGYPVPAPPGLNSAIPHTASPYVTLANPAYQSQGGSLFSFGYMLGFSYNLTKRFMFDALLQQNLGGLGSIKNADIKSLYSQPYIRFTIGYKLWKQK